MSKTKMVGILMIVSALLNLSIDILNGGGIDLKADFNSIIAALNGAGFYALRNALDKIG